MAGRRSHPVWRLGVPLVALAAGGLFGVSAAVARGTDLRGSDTVSLAQVVQRRTDEVAARAAEVTRLQAQVDAMDARDPAAKARIELADKARAQIAPDAGLQAVRGPALRVSLNDAPYQPPLPEGVSVDDIVVHQQDVQAVVNALWASGAEAMMIQDQRVVAGSAVRCVGNTLILQGRVYAPPYVITAVGDIARMRSGLDHDESVGIYRDYVETVGLGYEVSEPGPVTLPAYEGTVHHQYAVPLKATAGAR